VKPIPATWILPVSLDDPDLLDMLQALLTEEADSTSRPGEDTHSTPIVLVQSILYGTDQETDSSTCYSDLSGGSQCRMRVEYGLSGSVNEEC